MASLPLLRPLPSMMHHHHHPHPSSSSSSVSPNTHLLSDYSSAAQTVRLPTFHRSTTLLRVSSLHLNHHPIITPSPQTLTKMKTTPFPYSSSCFLRHPNTIDSSTSTTTISSISICKASSSSSSSSYQSSEVVPAKDRILSAVAYLLPFFNGLNFGVFLFDRFPILEIAFTPFVPLFSFYKSIPGANFMAFLALCFGVVRDRGFSRYVRRNALQATMLDVLLALPSLVNIVFDSHKGLKFRLLEISYGATFLVIVAGFLYAFGLSVLGRNPKFPFVSEAVDWQLSAVDRQF